MQNTKIFKKILQNGLTVLVRKNSQVPQVSVQLWYNVGSKDELSGEKGIAHLIEHMIFKGTKKLSESDINMITHKLSGSCNAFTSHDYTGYLFDFPSHHWQESLPIMADCMRNCTFKEDLLNSEMKAVIQELKMYRDNYPSTLVDMMLGEMFPDHPYHYPVIGFKQDLWSLKRDRLVAFYKKHYVPNNATLVVVGDVDPENVFELAEKNFGSIPANNNYKKEEFYHSPDIVSKNVTLYRDVQEPIVMLSYIIPGANTKNDYLVDVFSWILGLGKSSRLHKLLVDKLKLVTEIEVFSYDLFEHAPLFIYFRPKKVEDIEKIVSLVQKEIASILHDGISDEELERAINQTKTAYLSVLEDNQKQAYSLGQIYTATGDENYLINYINYPTKDIVPEIKKLIKKYLRPSVMHRGSVLPLIKEDSDYWDYIQKNSDDEDSRVLSRVTREVPVEDGVHVHTIKTASQKNFHFAQAKKIVLENGLTILYHHNPNIPMVEVGLSLQAKHYYDPQDQEGLNAFMSTMLIEGTKKHSGSELAKIIESRGISLNISPGSVWMSMLGQDLEKGLSILFELLTEPTFPDHEVEKVRSNMLANLKQYWDNPSSFVGHLARQQVYKNHPYSKAPFGTFESLEKIKRSNLLHAFEQFITPKNAVLVIVGDLENKNIEKIVTSTLGSWAGNELAEIDFRQLKPLTANNIIHPMNRDQIVLAYTGLSISRADERYDKLFLFDQILSGGVLGSMSSRLFALREQSGLFYTVGGSIISGSDKQPGMTFIKTIVSLDRLNEAEKALSHTIGTAIDTITQEELEQAKNAVCNSLVNNFASNSSIAATLMFIERFGLPVDYFDHRAQKLQAVTSAEIQKAVKSVLDINSLVRIKIGRL